MARLEWPAIASTHPESPLKTATLVVLVLGVLLVLGGLIPCLGWMNWLGVPLASAAAMLGVLGLATDRDPETKQARSQALYICALIFGLTMAVVGFLRCGAGGGIV